LPFSQIVSDPFISNFSFNLFRSYIITTIPYTNLLILVKDEKCRDDCQPHKLRINPTEIIYYNCQSERRHVDKLRRRPENCTNFHPGVSV